MSTRLFLAAVLSVSSCARAHAPPASPSKGSRVAGVAPSGKPVMYPDTTAERPDPPSPARGADGAETIVVRMKDGRYSVVPVTVENAPSGVAYGGRTVGKGNQLRVDADDFPSLARTGLHSSEELNRTEEITGRPVEEITRLGRPGASSGEGFLAHGEDILSVLRADNDRVRRLGLTHPELARPLFHVWNLILQEYGMGRVGRRYDNVESILYNGKTVRLGEVHPTRGFQESIFDDEITGAFDIRLHRELDERERAFLNEQYPSLTAEEVGELVRRLSHIRTGEMEPYYVMRYGFYEGHTAYRVDPIAIAFIFGLRSIEQIEAAFPGRLEEALTAHFPAGR